ncbi:MAG: hypothetical protein GY822_18825 [Deltaproteobacteria bacterium]|nr:hypothetical protein [Deltaproteobacteria bacterium]
MSDFSPIAIIGRGLVLPKAHDVNAFWSNVEAGVDCISEVPDDGRWGISPSLVTGSVDDSKDATWSTAGGYVTDFDPRPACEGTAVDENLLLQLDSVVHWSLAASRQALHEAGLKSDVQRDARTGIILGNLSFPSTKLAQHGEAAFLTEAAQGPLASVIKTLADEKRPHALNRFMSGIPSQIVAQALGLQSGAMCLDAACASSLYAMQVAVDWLHSGRADVMLAGAVNAADSLFIHVGFSALNALSKTGQTRPFHRGADGLLPGEGAGVLALMRLEEAQAQGKNVLGVIRGIGLSNDGRGRNLLAPSTGGQVRAIRSAWQRAKLDPASVRMLECHATGTSLGDLTEVNSLKSVFDDAAPRSIAMGSLKSNMGHLITGAGVAGMLKVLSSFENDVIPSTLNADEPLEIFAEKDLPFALSVENRSFEREKGRPRRAAVSAFGFGGNNAHVVLDDYQDRDDGYVAFTATKKVKTVVTGMGIRLGPHDSVPDFLQAMLDENIHPRAQVASIDGGQVRFPPNSLRSCLPQQLLAFEAVREAALQLPDDLPNERVGILIGMQCDVDVTTPGIRWRLKEWARTWNAEATLGLDDEAVDAWVDTMRDASATAIDAEAVLGQMPNIPANRLNVQLDLRGPGFTISAEELSGLAALRTAQDLLARNELDAVLVGSVDVCGDFRHQAATDALAKRSVRPADAAVVLVLRRADDVVGDANSQENVLAELGEVELGTTESVSVIGSDDDVELDVYRPAIDDGESDSAHILPIHPHSAAGLLDIAVALHGISQGVLPASAVPWISNGGKRACRVVTDGMCASRGALVLHSTAKSSVLHRGLPSIFALGAESRSELALRVQVLIDDDNALRAAAKDASTGACRLAVVGADAKALRHQLSRASKSLLAGQAPVGPDLAYSEAEKVSAGDVALVFGGAGNPKLGLGNNLLLHFPEVQDLLHTRTRSLRTHWRAETLFEGGKGTRLDYIDQLLIASCQMQAQARVLDDVLGVKAKNAFGFSLGEANAFCATGVFDEWSELLDEVDGNKVFTEALSGPMTAVRELWTKEGQDEAAKADVPYTSHLIRRSPDLIRDAVDKEDLVFITLIHSDHECVIGGYPEACRRVLDSLELPNDVTLELPYIPAVHSEVVHSVEESFRTLHTRHIDNKECRIFRMADGEVLELTTKACADAIGAQAGATLDFPRVVRSAASHGVKLFITMGAGSLASWIRDTKLETSAEVLAMPPGNRGPLAESGIRFARFAANLFVQGLDVNLAAFAPLVGPLAKAPPKFKIEVPAHHSFRFPLPLPNASRHDDDAAEEPLMRPAPSLPPVPRVPVQQKAVPASGAMASAPALPPVLNGGFSNVSVGTTLSPVTVQAQAAAIVPANHQAAPVYAPSMGTQMPSTYAAPVYPAPATVHDAAALALAQSRQHIQQAHAAFVEQQMAVHQQFLSTRTNAVSQLAALQGNISSAPVDVNPVGPGFQMPSQMPIQAPAPVQTQMPTHVEPTSPIVAPSVASVAPSLELEAKPAPLPTTAAVSAPVKYESNHAEVVTLSARRDLAEVKTRSQARIRPHHTEGTRENPLFDQDDLEVLASDVISSVFPPLFIKQDQFKRQVRMPEPPLMLCDRVIRINAEPGVLEKHKSMVTESDVTWDDWYLHNGHIPPGILIESGQADLLLISWMGVDFDNAGERVYRLLGCDLKYGDRLPHAGDTLHYDIHIDGFANMGDTSMFFFHSDCRIGGSDGELVLSVRNGQAGFFTDEELDNSGGVLWTPADEEEDFTNVMLDAPKVLTSKKSFTHDELVSFSKGEAFPCFGEGFEALRPHVRTPAIQGMSPAGQDMLLLDRVTDLDVKGGPWGRGYLKAELDLNKDRWFYDGHFKDDPCMPGTVMFEGCLQTLQFYLAANGYTIGKDGFRFEPVGGKEYNLICRGQATPSSKHMVYEVFVKELDDGSHGREPRIRADILVTVDGLKGLHCVNVEVQLVPDFPLNGRPDLLGERNKESGWDAVGGVNSPLDDESNVVFNQHALLATGWGKPSEAFTGMYEPFDLGRPAPRLPGPPYHFMSRVSELTGPGMGEMKAGVEAAVEYDVPSDSWYFDKNPADDMPFCVLLEVALQPCGWLSSYVGSALTSEETLFYRNLDGKGVQHAIIGRDVGTLITRAKMTKSSASAGMIIQEFSIRVTARAKVGAEETPIYDATTTFGFFPGDSFANQVGVGSNDEQKSFLKSANDVAIDLTKRPKKYCAGSLNLSEPMLLMVDRVTGYWPEGGAKGLGRVRTEKDVNLDEWFFKAHFFQDPVQPGSLGIEAMIQALQWQAIHEGLGTSLKKPIFEPLALHKEMIWKYRGQVVPKNKLIQVTTEIIEKSDTELVANAELWVDGLLIYTAKGIGIRVVESA